MALECEIDEVAEAVHDASCKERWADLPDDGLDGFVKAVYRRIAAVAIKRLDNLRRRADGLEA